MNFKFTFILASFLLSGCAPSELDFKKERLTGEEYCIVKSKLLPIRNSNSAELSLKHARQGSKDKAPIKAILHIVQSGREYKINPHELLNLYIDGAPYPLIILSSFQDPLEVIDRHSVHLPRGTLNFGSVQEITARRLSFSLPQEYMSKMVNAKKIVFEVSSFNDQASILLELDQQSIPFLQEFKTKCVTNFLNPSGENT